MKRAKSAFFKGRERMEDVGAMVAGSLLVESLRR